MQLRRLPGRLTVTLAALLLLSLLLHLWIASLTHPLAPTIGDQINPPSQWRSNRVDHFRVAIYNIHRGKGLDGVQDLTRVAGVLQSADVVGLNEVAGPTLLGEPNQAQQLGQMLETGWLFAANQYRWYRRYFGNALLSRFEVTHWFKEPLIHSEEKGRSLRNMITAEMVIGQQPVTVMVTHLDRGTIRDDQLRYILNEFNQHRRVILLGDFNTRQNHPLLIQLFEQPGVVDAVNAALGSKKTAEKVDWIITRGFNVLGGGMTPLGISDHPAFWVDLAIEVSD